MKTKRRVDFEYNRNGDIYSRTIAMSMKNVTRMKEIKSIVRMSKMKMMAKMTSKTVVKVSKMRIDVKIKIKTILLKTRARTNFEYNDYNSNNDEVLG